jgi:hypothetical protein
MPRLRRYESLDCVDGCQRASASGTGVLTLAGWREQQGARHGQRERRSPYPCARAVVALLSPLCHVSPKCPRSRNRQPGKASRQHGCAQSRPGLRKSPNRRWQCPISGKPSEQAGGWGSRLKRRPPVRLSPGGKAPASADDAACRGLVRPIVATKALGVTAGSAYMADATVVRFRVLSRDPAMVNLRGGQELSARRLWKRGWGSE